MRKKKCVNKMRENDIMNIAWLLAYSYALIFSGQLLLILSCWVLVAQNLSLATQEAEIRRIAV
jgi:hypothetical protein